ncbi:hypothetical protein F4781DRAFT_412218 [Annulohypoxylon bovei var. microspora]|nr:hypothetical protein F4781DRAFT_412218 [Annulohypoxylon bovei var. microspora]
MSMSILPTEILHGILTKVVRRRQYQNGVRLRSVNKQWNVVIERIIFDLDILDHFKFYPLPWKNDNTVRLWQRYMAYRALHNKKPLSIRLRMIRSAAERIVTQRWGDIKDNEKKLKECVNVICHNRYIFNDFRHNCVFYMDNTALSRSSHRESALELILDRFTSVVLSSTDDKLSALIDELYNLSIL